MPAQDPLQVFNSLILYYFLIDLLVRFQMQELPTLAVRPYLHLPVTRNQIINYLSVTSLASTFNLIPFILTIPFLAKTFLPGQAPVFIAYVTCITCFTLFNHFFSMWLKRKVNLSVVWLLTFFVVLLLLATIDFYIRIISISESSKVIFNGIMLQPLYCLPAIIPAFAMFRVNHSFLKENLYLDELRTEKGSFKSSTEIPLLGRLGMQGDLAANELKLIIRNKRPRSVLLMCLFFLLYGLIFYTKSSVSDYMIIFCGMFMTGIFIINYGQFMFSWQSSHFDGILVNRIGIADFFRSKFLLFTLFGSICFVLTIPYVIFGLRVLVIHAVMYLWNLGVSSVIVLYFANLNYKRIDLSKGSTFNWEGVGASQWVLSIPLLISPLLIFLPFSLAGYRDLGVGAIGLTGLVFIISREFWVGKLASKFGENRYTIAEGFRNKS